MLLFKNYLRFKKYKATGSLNIISKELSKREKKRLETSSN